MKQIFRGSNSEEAGVKGRGKEIESEKKKIFFKSCQINPIYKQLYLAILIYFAYLFILQ